MTQDASILSPRSTGFARYAVATLLRLEAAAVLAASVFVLYKLDGTLTFFFSTILIPDLSHVGYVFGPRIGASCYNVGHSYLTAASLAFIGLILNTPVLLVLAAVWSAHIGFDRSLGYGLKYADCYEHTHLGLIGRLRQTRPGQRL